MIVSESDNVNGKVERRGVRPPVANRRADAAPLKFALVHLHS